jgi:hypothetical protein
MITSHREEGLHYQLSKGQSMITSYIEEGLHYQLFKRQSMKTKIYRRRGSISTLYLAVRDNIKEEDGLHYQLLKGNPR